MGIEYQVASAEGSWPLSPDEARTLVQALRGYSGTRAEDGALEFRARPTRGGMPDLEIRLEPEGLYVCDNLGERAFCAEVLGELVRRLCSKCSAGVRVTEL